MGTTGSTWILWPCVPLFGLCMGAFGALSVLVIQDNFGLKSYGSISGVMNVATAASFAIGPIVTGITFDITDSYRIAFATVAAAEALGVVLLSQALRRKVVKQNSKIIEEIVTQAIAGAAGATLPQDFMEEDDDLDFLDDPLGIAVPWEEKFKKDKGSKQA